MVFSSAIFLFYFLPIVLVAYFLINAKFRNILLLFASLFFYSWGEPKNIILMLLSIVVNYFAAIFVYRSSNKKSIQRLIFLLAIMFNIGMLLVFKYTDFFIKNINAVFNKEFPLKHIALPIGISFFTFQSLSYVIDVKRQKVAVQKNFINLGLYISFFPQLIAGPIVRYEDFEKQIQSRPLSAEKFRDGILRFMGGFSKKILIADSLAPYVDDIFAQNGGSFPLALFGIIAYSLQIYFDFSGYSDMAIGLGKMFGFDFMENFNNPYLSKNIKDFWRRWHISLSFWFRDYVYIPLGGSRCSPIRSYANLMIVFFLTGFWHGASWNFIAWGVYYAVFLILERKFLGKLLEKMPLFLQHLYTIIVIVFGWIFFRAEGLRHAIKYMQHFFVLKQSMWSDFLYIVDRKAIFFTMIGILLSFMPVIKIKTAPNSVVKGVVLFIAFIISISFLLGTGFSPFLYFRF